MNSGGAHADKVWSFTRQAIPDHIDRGTPNLNYCGTPYTVFPGGNSVQHLLYVTLCRDRVSSAHALNECLDTYLRLSLSFQLQG